MALLLERQDLSPRSILIVDVAGTGRDAAVWLAAASELISDLADPVKLTLALPATPWAGRGRLLERYLKNASRVELDLEVLCGPASPLRSAPVAEERNLVRKGFDLIFILALSGSAGFGAPWPEHPARRWLSLADAAVLSFINPDSSIGELPRYAMTEPSPLRFRVETLPDTSPPGEPSTPQLVSQLDLLDVKGARTELAAAIETARRHPWRLVIQPPPGHPGTSLACPSASCARSLVAPLRARRILDAGKLRLVAAET